MDGPDEVSPPRGGAARWCARMAIAEAIGIGYGAALGALLAPTITPEASSAWRAVVMTAIASIGAVEGGALALAQAGVLKELLPRLRVGEWALPTVAFAALGWAAGMSRVAMVDDVAASTGPEPSALVQLALAVVLGALMGALLGAAQLAVLRHHARGAARWVVFQALGWALAMPAIFAGFALPGDGASDLFRVASGALGGAVGGALLGVASWPAVRTMRPWCAERPRALAGRRALVTGASAGIGAEVALGLARLGARTILAGRSRAALEATRARIVAAVPSASVEILACDLSQHASIDAAASSLCARGEAIDVLVHDAGATADARTLTEDDEELTVAVDALGPMRLTRAIEPVLSPGATIVVLTGVYHRGGRVSFEDLHFAHRPYSMAAANGQAQRLRFLWVDALARAWPSRRVIAVHPGAVRTRAIEHAPWWAKLLAATLARPGFVRAELGASPVLRVITDEGTRSGRFYARFTETDDVPTEAERTAMARWSAARTVAG